MWATASWPFTQTRADWSTAPKCSSTRPTLKPSGSVKRRRYQRYSPARSVRPTPESGDSGEKGTTISPAYSSGFFMSAVKAYSQGPLRLR